jgi:transposase
MSAKFKSKYSRPVSRPDPQHLLTRDELESRRLQAFRLWQSGKTWAEIARAVGVSRTTTSRWADRLRAGGPGALAKRYATGPHRRVTLEQLAEVYGTRQRWTGRSFQAAVFLRYNVLYHLDHAGRLLVKLGRVAKKSAAGGGR